MSTAATTPMLDTGGASVIQPQQPAPAPAPQQATPPQAQAAPQAASAPPAQPNVSPGNPNALGGNSAAPSPVQQAIASEPVNGPSWGARALHGIMAGLGGESTTVYQPGPNGTMVATTQPKTQGAQWKTIIAGALAGIGASAQAGSGPGQAGRAAALGVNAGYQQGQQQQNQQRAVAQQSFEDQQKAKVTNAQTSLLAQQQLASSLNLQRAHIDGTNADIERENEAAKLIQSTPGARDLGVIGMDPDKGDGDPRTALTRFVSGNPDLLKEMAQGNIQMVSAVKDGKVVGVHAFVLPQQWGDQKTNKDVTLTTFSKPDKPGDTPKETPYTIPSGSVTNREAMQLTMANSNASAQHYQNEFDQKQQTIRDEANNQKDLRVAGVDANARLRGAMITAGMGTEGANNGGVDGQGNTIDQAASLLAAGKEPPSMLSNRTGMKQAVINRATQMAKANGQDFSPETAEIQYQNNKKFLNSLYGDGTLGKQVISMNTFLGHAGQASEALQQLRGVLGNSPLINKPMNALKFATGSPEASMLETYKVEKQLAFTEWGNLQRDNRAAHTIDKASEDALSSINASPAVSQAALKAAAMTAVVRMRSIDTAYTMGPGRALPGGQVTHTQGMLSDESKQVLRDFGMDPQAIYTNNTGTRPAQQTQQRSPQGGTQQPGPSTHVFNPTAWAAANPGKDVNAAVAQAKAQGYQVQQPQRAQQ